MPYCRGVSITGNIECGYIWLSTIAITHNGITKNAKTAKKALFFIPPTKLMCFT